MHCSAAPLVSMNELPPTALAMDIEEFEKLELPRAKRSRLEPYQEQIFRLKAKGYANWQICQWLAANNVMVSTEAVRKFVISRQERASQPLPLLSPVFPLSTQSETSKQPADSAPALPFPDPSEKAVDHPFAPDNTKELTPDQVRQQREAKASHFIKSSNPLLKHIKKDPSK